MQPGPCGRGGCAAVGVNMPICRASALTPFLPGLLMPFLCHVSTCAMPSSAERISVPLSHTGSDVMPLRWCITESGSTRARRHKRRHPRQPFEVRRLAAARLADSGEYLERLFVLVEVHGHVHRAVAGPDLLGDADHGFRPLAGHEVAVVVVSGLGLDALWLAIVGLAV